MTISFAGTSKNSFSTRVNGFAFFQSPNNAATCFSIAAASKSPTTAICAGCAPKKSWWNFTSCSRVTALMAAMLSSIDST